MDAKAFEGLTGFPPKEWAGKTPAWAEVGGFAQDFEDGVGVPVQDLMQDRALLVFPAESLPSGFPSGMSIGRALLEARSEFLRTPFVEGTPYHLGEDQISAIVALTSVGELSQSGRACAAASVEDFYWLANRLQILGDVEPLVSEEGEGDLGKGGSVYRTYHCALDLVDEDERRRMLRLFTPRGAVIPTFSGDHRARVNSLWVVNSATHGVGILDPGDPYWRFVDDPALNSVRIISSDQLGLPDFPMLADFGGEPSRYCWLPMTEASPKFLLRLEVVLPNHPRHRARVLAGLDPESRAHAPEALVAVFLEYQSPLVQRCRGNATAAIGGTSVLMQYSLSEREEIAGVVAVNPHRYIAQSSKAALALARDAKVL